MASTAADAPHATPAPVSTSSQSDASTGLFRTGLDLLQQLAAATRPVRNGNDNGEGHDPAHQPQSPDVAGLVSSFVQHDPATGNPYLQLPVPSPEVVDRALQAVGSLLELFRR